MAGIFDLFGSTNSPAVYMPEGATEIAKASKLPNLFGNSGGIPNIGGIQADFVNLNNIVSGNAKSPDYGAGIGAGVGAFFGAPQEGAVIGRTVFPILNKTVRPALSNLWDNISK